MSHTPGPWPYRWRGGFIRIVGSDGDDIARMHPALRNEDNARLISAAPDLLEAAKVAEKVIDILWISHHANRSDDALEKLRAAIAKAIGEQA